MGNNPDGILNKLESLENILINESPSAIFLQETKTYRAGRIKTPSSRKYTWYELNRTQGAEKGEKGGGVAIGVLNSLEPSWISEGDNDTETITVEIWVRGFPIRLVCGYGPQKNDGPIRKESFWKYCSTEVQNAKKDGAGLIIQMDGNLWAGKDIIKKDPKPQNENGKYFENFLQQNPNLNVINALELCDGSITRVKNTKNGIQETIIDFFVCCDQILPFVKKMSIDKTGENSLTRYKNKVVKSDHRMLTLELDLTFHIEKKHERVETFNLKNKKCQKVFKEFTSKDTRFSKCFSSSEEPIDIQLKTWQHKFDKAIHACFKKIRIKENKHNYQSKMDKLMNEKKEIVKGKKMGIEEQSKVNEIDKQITEEIADKEYEKLKKILGDIETDGGETNYTGIWKEMRKAYPKKNKPLSTGVKNVSGKVITNPNEKKKVILEHFTHRMRKRPVKEELEDIVLLNEQLYDERLTNARKRKTPKFEMK